MLRFTTSSLAALAFAAVLLMAGPARAGGPPWNAPLGWPWVRPKLHGYNEPGTQPRSPEPARPAPAVKYTIQITVLPVRPPEADPNLVHVVAHVPEDARLWFDGQPTQQTGDLRYFVSPPLVPGRTFHYMVRAEWVENGRWVSQVHTFPVRAGDVHCLYLVRSDSPKVDDEIKANLARLNTVDRKLAEGQKYCAIQNGIRLGSMGVPVKISLKGQPVFLCCPACVDAAQANPDRTLATVPKPRAGQRGGP
jgi:uncharacterized protein (TIGR03000 family)